MGIYERLGVRRIINGSATRTRLGGSIMPPVVVEAMAEASESFVDMQDLQTKVGQRLAELTHNEAAFVTAGAAAGVMLSIAACITGKDGEKVASLPDVSGMKDEVIAHRVQRNGFEFAVRQTGARLVEIGNNSETLPSDLAGAINERTAAIVYFAGEHFSQASLPLDQVVTTAKAHGVPVVVDAAAQIPPVENLWRFTQLGADIAIFSGGKGLQGPQASGLVVGRRDLIEAMALHACPNEFIGRPAKVGKEEMVGLLAAVEWYLALDHEALLARYERQVENVIDEFSGFPGTAAERSWPSEAGQPMPRAVIRFRAEFGLTRDEVVARLKMCNPCIEVSPFDTDGIAVNPQTLEEGQEIIIASRIKEIAGR
jgi:D-glucosaminate-6-phosphate ammonia-lyase